ncbi:MAG TPA: glycosyltransferase family 39 protein [Thermohalobaculum sp.]|nr:glycosyltransferase family 39 protein [Thermohalobaculum sp.]
MSEGRVLRWLYLLSGPLILAYALFVAAPNVFVIDGAVYYAMVDAMAREGSFAIWNGYEIYHSPSLDLRFTSPVDDRLMPQYPGGWAFLAAPFYLLGGIRGLFLLNALATVATIWLVRATAAELFGSRRLAVIAALVFVFATFAFDYAGAVWPHALTTLGIATATLAAARAWRRERPGWALAAGLALGVAVHFRVDAILAAPAIGFWLLAATNRPWANTGAFAAGLVPGLAAASAINFVKFGSLAPITYGRSGADGGAPDLVHYAGLLPFAVMVLALALALGFAPVRRAVYRPAVVLGLAAVLAVICLLPPLQPHALRLLRGAGAMLVDIQAFRGVLRPDLLQELPDGTVQFLGYHKKALLQSLPWLAGCLVLAPRFLRGPDRAGLCLLALVPAAIVVPLAWSAWLGGLANHMRYLVNLLPALSILGAVALDQLAAAQGRSRLIALAAGAAAVLAGLAAGYGGGHGMIFVFQNSLPNVIVAALAGVSLLAVLSARPALVSAARGVMAAALALAFVSAWGFDLALHQSRRLQLQQISVAARAIPPDAVIQAIWPTAFYDRIGRRPGLVALYTFGDKNYDADFIGRVLAEGRPLFVQNQLIADQIVADGVAASAEPALGLAPADELYRMVPPP